MSENNSNFESTDSQSLKRELDGEPIGKFFPLACGRCYRVGGSKRVEPDPQYGYLYLLKSPETSEYILTWEPESTNSSPIPADQRWCIPFGAPAQLKRIPGQAAFVLLLEPSAPPRFFWVDENAAIKAEQAAEAFKEVIAVKPSSPPNGLSLQNEDDSEAAKVSRALLLASVAYQQPIDPNNPYNRPPPVSSTLDPWLPHPESVNISDILQVKLLQPLLSDPGVIERLLPLLPPEIEAESAEDLIQVLRSPQYQNSLQTFDAGLKYGELGQLTTQMGLDVIAGRGTTCLYFFLIL
ncbi:hypothetical protein DSO57_1005691 [Entomophthora muscae]|uniref:Uncharacterized protein n=1 Tax=Entomophthora muscae TaxID=34485 RepID=A0ACC2TVP3_9FUNG|nr:hypothetical protein DSO57_1005691 [Entomophthora muscae]